MIRGSCHCGAVRFVLAEEPRWLTRCTCSLCRRIGALWAHADAGRITLSHEPDATIAYVQGDKTLALHTCRTCGCTTHWTSLDQTEPVRMAVNCTMAEPADIRDLRVRNFDGADRWEYLDEPGDRHRRPCP